MDISPKALKIAKQAAQVVASRAINFFTYQSCRTWTQLEHRLGIDIPTAFKSQPCDYLTVEAFASYWKSSVESRIKSTLSTAPEGIKLKPSTQCDTYGSVTLLPEQQAVVDALWTDMFVNKTKRSVYQDGTTGSGKTFAVGALLCKAIANNFHKSTILPPGVDMPFRYWIITRKNVRETYVRWLEEFGLGKYIGNLIYVSTYSAMTSSAGQMFFEEVFDPITEESSYKFNEIFLPCALFLDEAHALNNQNTQQTRFIDAINKLKHPPVQLRMSATPWVTVNNSRSFVLSTNLEFAGMKVTEDTFSAFAGSICAEPHKPNMAAAKRLREVMSPYIYSFPYVKWPHKAVNQILIVDFEKPEHKVLYNNAFEIYQERKRKAGQNTNYGKFEEFVALNQFRYAVEPFHIPSICELALADLANGKSVAIGTAFREPLSQAVYKFTQLGISRDRISVIWGGKRAWKKEFILNDEDLNALLRKGMTDSLDEYEVKSLQETILFKTDRIMHAETETEQSIRLQAMSDLGLTGAQSLRQRQAEIDKFQTSIEPSICLFTLAAGGVGLSLDQHQPYLPPRIGYFTPTYSGPEFKQALGRLVRRTTHSDTYQFMVMMKDTVEEYHVAPRIDIKLKCIAETVKSSFNIVDLDTSTRVEYKLRSTQQAELEAEDEKSQFQAGDSDGDEEDEN